jgi:4-hydroxy-tetrahydrodipicolinate synthase
MQNTQPISGVIPPMVTPFDQSEELDERRLRSEARYLLSTGVHGISIGGSTGEGALLSDGELARGIAAVQEENERRVPVICGIIRNSSRDSVKAGLAAKNAGADALMVTPTFYHGATDQGNYAYFDEIADRVGLPIIIYNVIKANPIAPALMLSLSEIELVVGIKQSVGGIHALAEMIAAVGQRARVYGAQDDLLFVDYGLGACGAISAILTLFPEECVQQWNLMRDGDWLRAKAINDRIAAVWRHVDQGMVFPGALKAALNLRGRDVGIARRPILPPHAAIIDRIGESMRQHGFLP